MTGGHSFSKVTFPQRQLPEIIMSFISWGAYGRVMGKVGSGKACVSLGMIETDQTYLAAHRKCMNTPQLHWETQRVFLAVLRTGSLSAASRALGVAQATARRRIDELEHSVGVSLFVRSPKGLMPTDTARELAGHAESMAWLPRHSPVPRLLNPACQGKLRTSCPSAEMDGLGMPKSPIFCR